MTNEASRLSKSIKSRFKLNLLGISGEAGVGGIVPFGLSDALLSQRDPAQLSAPLSGLG